MSEELKIAAYALSSTGKDLNLDNMYVNGRFVNVGSDTKSTINKVSHADFQIYGVCDSEIGTADNRQLGVTNSQTVMQMAQRLQTALADVGKIEKDRIWEAIVETNRDLRRQKNELGLDEMGSSFAGLFLHGNRGLAVHLGDSRIYVVRGGRMLQITDDHLESSDMYRLGVISQSQAEVHKRDSHLTAYLGMDDVYDAKDEAFSKYFVFYPGDTFILCTDGLSDAIDNEEMERIIRLLKDATVDTLATMLMKAASEHSPEDMTIMVLRVEEAPGEAPKRGTSTIPRKENYEKRPASTDTKTSVLPHIPRSIRKTEPDDVAEEEADREEEASATARQQTQRIRQQTQRFSPITEDPKDYEDEEDMSLLDKLLSNPKRLAIIIGAAVLVIVLLVVIIMALSGGNDNNSSSAVNNVSTNSSTLVVDNSSAAGTDSSVDISGATDSSLTTDSSQATSTPTTDSSTTGDSSAATTSDSSTTTAQTGSTYTVQDGDYFYSIVMSLYDSGDLDLIEAFAAYNGMTLDSSLYPGMTLQVPPIDELTSAE